MKNNNQKRHLGKIVLACGLIGAVWLESYYLTSPKNYETIFEKRARYLNIANEQMLKAKTPEEINGLNSVIKDIEKGVYDYSK